MDMFFVRHPDTDGTKFLPREEIDRRREKFEEGCTLEYSSAVIRQLTTCVGRVSVGTRPKL